MEYRTKQRIFNRRISNAWKTLKEMFIFSHQGNANQNNSEIPLTPVRMVKIKNTNDSFCWRGCGDSPPLLVRMQICTTILKISMVLPQKIMNQPTSGPSNTTLGNIFKGCSIILQGHLFKYVHSGIICNIQNLKQPRCPSREEWIKKISYIYTMEHYSVVKKNDILKFACKWIELERNPSWMR